MSDGGLHLTSKSSSDKTAGGKAALRFKPKKTRSVHETYRRMTGVEHVLHRPELYVGMTAPISETWWIPRPSSDSKQLEQRMVRRGVTFSPALFKIFDEIIVNAADNKMRNGDLQTRIDVTVTDTTVSIYNDGPGIPVVRHKKHNMYIPHLIFGHLLTSSNYDDKEQKVTGGRHGYGAKLTNIFSRHFKVETVYRGTYYEKSWSKNMKTSHNQVIKTKVPGRDWTRITFEPDLSCFKLDPSTSNGGDGEDGSGGAAPAKRSHSSNKDKLEPDIMSLMQRRTLDVAATCGVNVTWNGKKAEHVSSFLDYVLTFLPPKRVRVISSIDLTLPSGKKLESSLSSGKKMSETGALIFAAGGGDLDEDEDFVSSSPSAPVAKITAGKPRRKDHLGDGADGEGADESASGGLGGKQSRLPAEMGSRACPLTHSENTIRERIAEELTETRGDKDRELLVYHQRTKYYDVVLAFHMDAAVGRNDNISFVNNVATHNGGTHLKHIQDVVIDALTALVPNSAKGAAASSKSKDLQRVLRNMVQVFVSAIVPNPTFGSQIKDKLITPLSDFKTNFRIHNLTRYAFRHSDLPARIMAAAEREMGMAVANSKMKGTRIYGRVNLPKLEDANWAGTKNSNQCTLILTEGDSAKALAVSGLAVVGRDRYGVFPLKGKLLNVREVPLARVAENDQLSNVMKAMGLRFGEVYTQVPELRYGRIMIMADQDHDGSHIKGLFMNFIATFWPSLLEIPGFITQFVTPIVKALPSRGSGDSITVRSFFCLPDFQRWRVSLSAAESRKYTFKYYKGLGTSTAAEGREYFKEIERHSIEMVRHHQPRQDDAALELAFDSSMIEGRKVWVSSHSVAEHVGVDYRKKKLTFFDFIHKELILFSVADCERSIPNFIDGLKPSQRKVLYGCFKRNLTRSMKVEALGGYIGEQTAYHHGEKSLHDTMVNLAQDFVGANNIPLLVPDGQFGTRHEGGRDHASARYIFTHLAPITRLLFPPADDVLLRYKDDDGFPIEPYYYVPVIPLVLVNGASGIGTGFSTSVPQHNPLHVIAGVRQLLQGKKPDELVPWHEGFTGTYESAVDLETGDSYCWTTNVIYFSGKDKLQIADLAPGVTTASAKTMVVKMVTDELIAGFTESHTPSTVHFELDLSEPKMLREIVDAVSENATATKESLEKSQLEKQNEVVDTLAKGARFGRAVFRTNNMYGFDRTGTMRLFKDTTDVMEEHFAVRLKLYEDRYRHITNVLEHQLAVEESRHAFLSAVCSGTLKLSTLRDESALIAYMKKQDMTKHFPAVKTISASAASTEPVGDGGGDGGSGGATSGAGDGPKQSLTGYEYLMCTPISSFNKENVARSEEKIAKLQVDLQRHKLKTPNRLFHEDLNALEAALKEYYAKREKCRNEERPKRPGKNGGGGGGGDSSSSVSSSSSSGGGSGSGSGGSGGGSASVYKGQPKSSKNVAKEMQKLLSMVGPAEAAAAVLLQDQQQRLHGAPSSSAMMSAVVDASSVLVPSMWINTVAMPAPAVVMMMMTMQQQQQHSLANFSRSKFLLQLQITATRAMHNAGNSMKTAVSRMLPKLLF